MRWTKSAEQHAATYFRAHYVLWVLGQLEPEVEQELDALSQDECENWKQIMYRECSWTPHELQTRFHLLRQTRKMSTEDALDWLLTEIGFAKSEGDGADRHRADVSPRRRRFAQRGKLSAFRLFRRLTF